jgi:hypothetical protein
MKLNNSVFNIAVSNSYCIVLNDWMAVNNELGSMWKEVAVASLQHLCGRMEGKP